MARLEALTGQLQPHFLFNILQGVSTLMHRDPTAADLMLSRLSELLRRTLDRGDRQEVSLGEEMDLLGQYVGIMQVRFRDRLLYSCEMQEGSKARWCHTLFCSLSWKTLFSTGSPDDPARER